MSAPVLDFVLLLLSSYHRRRRLISEALELRVEVVRVSCSWCMCVISHGYGRLGEGRDGGGGRHACRTEQRGLVACWSMPQHILSAR